MQYNGVEAVVGVGVGTGVEAVVDVGVGTGMEAVVGAGVGGLYTAARLAKAGVKTTLVEQNPREDAGGRLETIWLDSFLIDDAMR